MPKNMTSGRQQQSYCSNTNRLTYGPQHVGPSGT